MADLYGTPPDSEEMSNILSQLLHGSSASSTCMPFKSINMHLLHSPPPPHTSSSNEDHHRSAVVESSSDFNFSESGGYFSTGIMDSDANTSLRGRRISSENDLGHVTCDSEGPVAPEVPLNAAGPRSSSKRSRAAEVHNLSEKRRRSKINEKMKALQHLIPNSNKTDKASMLDEAIEYLKQLQLQVQMLTMRNGLSLHPMCLPGAAQPMQLAHIGLGFEEGSEGRHKVPKWDRGINPYYGNEENSIHYAYNTSGGCTISNHPTVLPAVGNVPTSEASFGFEPSNQAHYRPFSVATSSQEVFSDSEPPSKSDSNRSGKKASADTDKLSSKRPDV